MLKYAMLLVGLACMYASCYAAAKLIEMYGIPPGVAFMMYTVPVLFWFGAGLVLLAGAYFFAGYLRNHGHSGQREGPD